MKKFISLIVGGALVVSCAMAAEYTIKFAHVVSPDTPKGKAADYFAKRVFEITEGKVEVVVFPSSQLYNDNAVFKALKLGNVQMAAPALSKFAGIVPAMQIFDLPFLFEDVQHVHRAVDGEVGAALKDMVNKKGFIALDFWDNGLKHFSSNKKAILTPGDAKGQKIRIMSSKVLEAQMKTLGASSQILPFSEVYSALQQGVVDGAENPMANFYTEKFYEVQSSITMSGHGYLGYLVVMSERFWKKFPEDLKPKIMQAVKEATLKEREMAQELEIDFFQKVEDYATKHKSLTMYKLTPEQRDAFRDVTSKIYPSFYKIIGEDLIKKVQSLETK